MSELEQKYFEATGTIATEEEIKEELHHLLINDTGAPVMFAGMRPAAARKVYAAAKEVN